MEVLLYIGRSFVTMEKFKEMFQSLWWSRLSIAGESTRYFSSFVSFFCLIVTPFPFFSILRRSLDQIGFRGLQILILQSSNHLTLQLYEKKRKKRKEIWWNVLRMLSIRGLMEHWMGKLICHTSCFSWITIGPNHTKNGFGRVFFCPQIPFFFVML